jgi:type II secretory pathway pseudopilin PulG
MDTTRSAGFTIVELILFLALSSLFLSIAFVGVRGRQATIQFTDSMRSLENFVKKQQNQVFNGVNLRDSSIDCQFQSSPEDMVVLTLGSGEDAGSDEDCVVAGAAVKFDAASGALILYPITGRYLSRTFPPSSAQYLDFEKTDLQIMQNDLSLTINGLDLLSSSYEPEWGAKYVDSGGSSTLAIIKSPSTSKIYLMTDIDFSATDLPKRIRPTSLGASGGSYCFEGTNGQDASLVVNSSDNSTDSIAVEFDTGCS